MVNIGNDWDERLSGEWTKDYYVRLRSFLINEYREQTVYPPMSDIFNALKLTPYKDVKVVILGQDPYHEPGQAQGLAFSVPGSVQAPPSLINIMKELQSDLGIQYSGTPGRGAAASQTGPAASQTGPAASQTGSAASQTGPAASQTGPAAENTPTGILIPWAKQGVLLLNTVLTVRAHQAGSHRGKGWEQFTDRVIELLAMRETPMVFILWGANARSKKDLIIQAQGEKRRHLIIEAPHPSPLSAHRGFFGGRYFSRCNYFLEDNGVAPVDWSL